jgi:hypothetical protein
MKKEKINFNVKIHNIDIHIKATFVNNVKLTTYIEQYSSIKLKQQPQNLNVLGLY